MLSWIGKAGLKKSDRRALGYHAKPGDTQVNLYSRDVQAAPMRRMWKLELAIQNGKFRPDETRSGYFAGEHRKGEEKFGAFILAKIYDKAHVRKEGTSRSICGRAFANRVGFEVFASFPEAAKSRCGHCFKGRVGGEKVSATS